MGALAAQEDEEGRGSPMAGDSRSHWRSLQLLMTTANASLALVTLAAATVLFLTLAYSDARSPSSSSAILLRRISAATSSLSRASSDYSERPLCDASHGDDVLGDGQWVYHEASRPFYTSETCPFLDPGFQCRASGRPDSGYLHWSWLPNRCRLPRFDPKTVLERLRGVRVAFVGDSIGRNQWESLLCMLAAGTRVSDVYEVNRQPITKHTGYLAFRFAEYNCSIEYYRSPFLVPQTRPPPGAPRQVSSVLRVDTPDWSSPLWVGANVLVFNGGHWWNYEKTLRGGCYFSELGKVDLNMTVTGAYERALSTILDWVREKAGTTQHVFFRTYSPVHFRNGTWRTGGQCHAETEPLQPKHVQQQQDENEQWTNRVLRARLSNTTTTNKVQLLDITRLTEHRKDGHPSLWYRGPGYPPAPKNRQDCSHWCLPGVPDTWNLLLLHKLGLLG